MVEQAKKKKKSARCMCACVKEGGLWEQELGSAESGTITSVVCHVSLGPTQKGSGDSS